MTVFSSQCFKKFGNSIRLIISNAIFKAIQIFYMLSYQKVEQGNLKSCIHRLLHPLSFTFKVLLEVTITSTNH